MQYFAFLGVDAEFITSRKTGCARDPFAFNVVSPLRLRGFSRKLNGVCQRFEQTRMRHDRENDCASLIGWTLRSYLGLAHVMAFSRLALRLMYYLGIACFFVRIRTPNLRISSRVSKLERIDDCKFA
jgi:hypothetical protein